MRPRVVAASAATLIAAASMAPVAAQAAGQNALYVNSGSAACTDSGSGTFAAPFCTIQAAADVANPGDVVVISAGTYASGATITRSGTASAPIVFTGAVRNAAIGADSTASSELTVSGASNIQIENLEIFSGSSASVTVDGGSDVTINNDSFTTLATAPNEGGSTAVHVTGGASGVTIRDSHFSDGILVDDGATGTVVTTNMMNALYSTPIAVQGAQSTAITSNTVSNCSPGVSVTDSSAATSIENNIVEVSTYVQCPTVSTAYGVLVDASSAAGTTLDYNDVYPGSDGTAYSWNGAAYSTGAELYAVTAQGKHDYNGFDGTQPTEGSPLINSANSAAVGEQPLDVNGNPRVLDPLVAPTGVGPYDYYDRGATQFQDPYTVTAASTYAVSQTKVPVGTTITAKAAVADTWGDTFTSYEFYISDNEQPVVSSTPTASFTPTAIGTYYSDVLGATGGSSTYHQLSGLGAEVISVVAQQPLVANESLTASGELGLTATDTGTTDEWNIASATFDFGDGQSETVADGAQALHTYAKGGTYTVTETVKDVDGNTATTSSQFTTTDPGPGTLESMQYGNGVPAGAVGIAQSAMAGTSSGVGLLVAATTSGQAEIATGDFADMTGTDDIWQPWQPVSQPGVTVKWVGVAGFANGSAQLIEVTSTGTLLHTVRNADGTWQSSGWGSPAGSTGFAQAAITAMPDGSAQLVAVTTAGVLMHNIRAANGAWQGWRALSQPGVKIVNAAIAGEPDGSSQIAEVTSTSVLKHDIRFASGSWQSQGWGTPAGGTGISQVSIVDGDGSTELAVLENNGSVEHNYRLPNGSWPGWEQVSFLPALSVSNVSIGFIPPNHSTLMFGVSAG